MNRLPLFKALADSSRYAVYLAVVRSPKPLSTNEIADALVLHPNTVRLHLERLRDAGLVDLSIDGHRTVGRPQHLWSATPVAPSLGLEPSGFRMLAHVLADVAVRADLPPEAIREIGRSHGRSHPDPRAGVAEDAAACVRAVVDGMGELGFDPVVEDPVAAAPGGTSVAFTRCPFRELATAYPDLVCQLHHGILEGILERQGVDVPVRIHAFRSLVDEDPCRVELATG